MQSDIYRLAIVSTVLWNIFHFRVGGAVEFLGYEAEWRDNEDHEKRFVQILDPSQTVRNDGMVTGWNVYTTRGRRSQVVHLQIWRPAAADDTITPVDKYRRRYRRVGETVIAALWVGHNFFTLYPVDRIAVLRGDVLGLFYPGYNPIPWSSVPCSRHGNEQLFKNMSHHRTIDHVMSTDEIEFEKRNGDSNPCRRYSLNATIMDDNELIQFDYEYQDTTDGRYERRPYGRYLRTRRFQSRSSSTSVLNIKWNSHFTFITVLLTTVAIVS